MEFSREKREAVWSETRQGPRPAATAPVEYEGMTSGNFLQARGCLLCFDTHSLRLQRYSVNAPAFLSQSGMALGNTFVQCAAEVAARAILGALQENQVTGRPALLFNLPIGPQPVFCDIAVHVSGDDLVIECTPPGPPQLAGSLIRHLRSAIDCMRENNELLSLCQAAVVQMRMIVDYDHVMLYRFAPHGLAEVMADDCAPGLPRLSGQYISREGMPDILRKLYRRSLIRVVENVSAEPVEILSAPGLPPLDLSLVMMRASSECRQAYMSACGVEATMLLALIVDGALWGMLIGRNYTPKNVTMDERAVAKMFSEYVALQIAANVRASRLQVTQKTYAAIHGFVHDAASATDIPAYIRAHAADLMSQAECDGVAVWIDGHPAVYGFEISPQSVSELVRWSGSYRGGITHIWDTVSLVRDVPSLVTHLPGVAGMMVVPLTAQPGDYLYFFRKEKVRIVNRAPLPGESPTVRYGKGGLCHDTVHDCSATWTVEDEEAAEELRAALIEATGTYYQALLEQRSQAEARQRLLNDELTHRVKNILSIVQSVVGRSIVEERSQKDSIQRLRDRIKALAVAHDQIVSANSGGYLYALLEAELAPYTIRPDAITVTGPDLWMPGKALSVMTLLFHELATNAAKYGSLSCEAGHLAISWTFNAVSQSWDILWKESGGPPVSEPTHLGFGSMLLSRALTHELGGVAERTFCPDGVNILLSVPARFVNQAPEHDRKPWSMTHQNSHAPAEDQKRDVNLRNAHVLIVEDQMLIAMEIEDILTDHGVAGVLTAASVSEAKKLILSSRPDVAVLDINLGEEDVIDVAVILRERKVAFIFTTGYTGEDMIPPEFADVPVIHKPYAPSVLIRNLQAALA
ncbi:HWE histidine kinase domain-containing protein [Acetobacter sp.]|jgi:light-regulated signal transduction histidine kinase (bacteriophytochrome)|uniref:HWE histidine kinase domain-containing protein n=1 Tax=Acetobacter sp. TaxID=440 RepID=UPI0025C46CDE|nr:HWE histidine kinase domain-containing protein [Acetobacter sp.]MCH4090449.1 response regulator [Acetobacter sp.]MCI1299143.1 response regulator [Acetobacter sp.]MCI1315690.1 response regulator [Acetobacter sp.]